MQNILFRKCLLKSEEKVELPRNKVLFVVVVVSQDAVAVLLLLSTSIMETNELFGKI